MSIIGNRKILNFLQDVQVENLKSMGVYKWFVNMLNI
jgi:hypothetical protein